MGSMNLPAAQALRPLRLLVVEDTHDDALLLVRVLRKAGFQPDFLRVDNPEALERALEAGGWDIVISDYTMPDFGGLLALDIVRRLAPDLPFIIVSGNIGEDVAVGAMRAGAQDYVLKHALGRLGPAIERELAEAANRRRRQEAETALHKAAYFDALTGLPNRALLQERLARALARHAQGEEILAVMLVDLDRFKNINDSLGHQAGDRVLCELARRLELALRADDLVARVSGDEFAVVLPHIAQEEDLAGVAQKLIRALAPPIDLDGSPLHCSASLGIGLFPRDGDSVEALLRNADAAMHEAKRAGRDTFRFYAQEMNAAAGRRLKLENALRGALERNELELHYQPQLDLDRNGAICGFEALLRWKHAELGPVSPAEFIPIAEETGLIVPIGEWVLANACRQAKQWVENFDANLRMAVNLSVRNLLDGNCAARIEEILRRVGVAPGRLELELTETAVMSDPEAAVTMLGRITATGARLAIDDFGTGYSSLAYLRRFPVQALKIDRSFVAELAGDESQRSQAIVRSTLYLARSLGLRTVAEGVETLETALRLRDLGCDIAQGDLFARPAAAAELERSLGQRHWQIAIT